MKQLLPILLIALCYACGDTLPEEIPYTIIRGKILNPPLPKGEQSHTKRAEILQKRKEINLVSTAIRSGLNVPNHQAMTDDEGNYHFLIRIEQPTEIRLQYGYAINLPLYAKPGDEIVVDIDYLHERSENTPTYKISGDNAALNQQISSFDQLFKDSFRIELNATLPYAIPREFKTQRANITKRIRRLTQNYIKENAANNTILANWVQYHSEYRIAMDYMKYAFRTYGYNQFSPDLKDGFSEHYFDFFDQFPIDNPSAITNLNYQNYLQFYRKYLMSKLRKTAPYQDCVNLPTCNEFEMEITHLSQDLTGQTKDLTLAQQADYHLTRNNAAFLKTGFPLYLKEITDSILTKDLIARKAFLYKDRTVDLPKTANLIQSDANGNDILKAIVQRHPNSSILLYFWNTQRDITWRYSSPSHSEHIWKGLDSLNIKLVLLAHHSTPNLWKDKIIAHNLIQDQWHLNDEQFTFFEDYFYATRKPHMNYDKIYDRENFILLLDNNQQLATLDDISFRERNFTPLNMLVRQFKYMIAKQRKAQITADSQ